VTFLPLGFRLFYFQLQIKTTRKLSVANIAQTTTITLLTRYHLCLLLLVRLGGYIVNLLDFYSYRLIGKLTVSLKLQEFTGVNQQWTFPLPPLDVLFVVEGKSRQYPRQGCRFTYQLKYCWVVYHFKNTYSPITLANISSIR
jgi:hypothetical protein